MKGIPDIQFNAINILFQIRFFGLKGQTKRSDLSARKKQDLWTLFSGIEWHGKTFQEGKLVTISLYIFQMHKFQSVLRHKTFCVTRNTVH